MAYAVEAFLFAKKGPPYIRKRKENKKTDAGRVKTVCSEKGTTIAPPAALYRLTSFRIS
jgi:hypothetical protein